MTGIDSRSRKEMLAHLGGRDLLVGGQLAGDAVGVDLREERTRRREQAERDAGDGGVHAGLEHREPDADAERRRRRAGSAPWPA